MMPGIVARRRRGSVGGGGGVIVPASALNHFDANLSTDDVGGNTWIPAGSASHHDAISKFGAGCLQISGTGSSNRITVSSASNFVPEAADDFTWAAWVYIVGSSFHDFFPLCFGTSGSLGSEVRVAGAASPTLTFAAGGTSTPALPLDEWVHLAVTRESGTVRAFVNGVVGGPIANSTDFTGGGSFNAAGVRMANTDTTVFYDEFLFLNGAALWTDSFTPPEAPYELAA